MICSHKVGRASARLFRGKHACIQGGLKPALLLALALAPSARAEDTFYAQRVAPILEQKCVACHGEKKQKGKLRLDSFAQLMRGGEGGGVVQAGDAKDSELFVRVTLHPEDEDFMPADSKPPLTPDEVKVLELWIAAGASETAPLSSIKGAPALAAPKAPTEALAPDWRPRTAQIAQLEKALGLRLVARSHLPTDGLVLRTAGAPGRCDDTALAHLAPVADLIVEAELARTKITDAGLVSLATFANLRALDLTRTAVTSAGLGNLASLGKLESLNLTSTGVDDAGVARLKDLPALRKTWVFDTRVGAVAEDPAPSAK
jgi:hypothetical protein